VHTILTWPTGQSGGLSAPLGDRAGASWGCSKDLSFKQTLQGSGVVTAPRMFSTTLLCGMGSRIAAATRDDGGSSMARLILCNLLSYRVRGMRITVGYRING
jgi:hypothetical protein